MTLRNLKNNPYERYVLAAALLVGACAGCKGSDSRPVDANVIEAKDAADAADATHAADVADGADAATEMPPPCVAGEGRDNGETCSCGTQCASGFCADGVCCDSACGGLCMSCSLSTSLGTCSVIPAGVKPRAANDCKAEDNSTCGLDGTCDGSGKCRSHLSGTICRAGVCDSDSVSGTFTCDGARACKQSAVTICAPFSCDKTKNLCFPTCSSDADCVSGRKCVNGSCGPKMNGAACLAGSECASTHCADGICCNTACDGECRACNLVDQIGSCAPIPAGLGHPMCALQAASSCGTTGVCDGFGTCSLYPTDSFCGAASCSGATAMNTARTCDGAGTCQASEIANCGSYRCATGRCNATCATNAECADGIACVNGSCGPRLDGQSCMANADCLNLHCVTDVTGGRGICCNTACTGPCRSCALPGTLLGRCSMVANGAADPRATCVDRTASTCGTDGRCDGTGACRSYASGTVCAAETCLTDVYTGPSTCNTSGQCIKPAASPCSPYHCNATKCFGSCTTNAQCIAPNTCGMNGAISSCGLKPSGAVCSAGTECSSKFCAQGVCCNSACNTACHACNLAGTTGTCSNVNSGADPQRLCAVQAQSTCGTTGQCAAGSCARWAAGTVCRAAAGVCDVAETCNGTGTACPGNGFASATTICRASGGACDVAETCSATTATCPGNTLRANGFVCRVAGGECDVAEACDGTSTACPTDAKRASGIACPAANVDTNPCTLDQCDGAMNTCQHPAGNMGTLCRMAAGECDVADACNGTSTACPTDLKKASGTPCPVANVDTNPCTLDQCNGAMNTCQHPAGNLGTLCREAAGECDVADACNGTSTACPIDAVKSRATACTDDKNPCTADHCSGVDATCTHPNLGNGPQPGCGAGDTDLCNGTNSCNAGTCAMVDPVTCGEPGECQGVCDPKTGKCSDPMCLPPTPTPTPTPMPARALAPSAH